MTEKFPVNDERLGNTAKPWTRVHVAKSLVNP